MSIGLYIIISTRYIHTCMCLSVCACEQVGSRPDGKKRGDGEEGKKEPGGHREV